MTVNLKLLTAQTVVMCGFRSGPLSGGEPNRKTWDKVFESRGLLAQFDKSDPSQPAWRRGIDWLEGWILTADAAILVMCASLLGTVSFFPIEEAHFLLSRYL